jgi:AraC-like DNA-binding protein
MQIQLTRIGSIAQIAKDCGFSSSAALVRFFKSKTGLPPNHWRGVGDKE